MRKEGKGEVWSTTLAFVYSKVKSTVHCFVYNVAYSIVNSVKSMYMYSTVYTRLGSVAFSKVLVCLVSRHSLSYNYLAGDAKLYISPLLTNPFYTVIFTKT